MFARAHTHSKIKPTTACMQSASREVRCQTPNFLARLADTRPRTNVITKQQTQANQAIPKPTQPKLSQLVRSRATAEKARARKASQCALTTAFDQPIADLVTIAVAPQQ
nr:putative integron gene cassette protein [uncultured bacterium]